MMKKIFLISIVVLCLFSAIVSANNITGEKFKPGRNGNADVQVIGEKIIGFTRIIGTIVALGTLAMLGIKLMLSAPSDKADIKSKAVLYLVGALMIFSIVQLLDIVYKIVNK